MAYSGFATTPNLIRCGSGIVTAVPLTFSAWGYTSDASTAQTMVMVGNSASAVGRDMFSMRMSAGNLTARTGGAGSQSQAVSTTSISANTWFHGCATFSTTTSRTIYLNNGGSATDTGSQTPSGINRATIGADDQSTIIEPWLGSLAEVGVWNVVLDDAERAALAAGISPLNIRPQSLIAYVPLIKDLVDYKGNAFAVVGSLTTGAEHCRIYGVAA